MSVQREELLGRGVVIDLAGVQDQRAPWLRMPPALAEV
jgi:hypothetical protein